LLGTNRPYMVVDGNAPEKKGMSFHSRLMLGGGRRELVGKEEQELWQVKWVRSKRLMGKKGGVKEQKTRGHRVLWITGRKEGEGGRVRGGYEVQGMGIRAKEKQGRYDQVGSVHCRWTNKKGEGHHGSGEIR